uniref:Uncharacterized protein n=1 Tax=Romanomermis culicivorax TaxID=13658 RepID=A0A915HGP3_ROMCU
MNLMIKNARTSQGMSRLFLILFLISGFRCQIQASGDGELENSDKVVDLNAQLLTEKEQVPSTTKTIPLAVNGARNGLAGFGRQLALLSNYWQLHWRACAIKITKLLQVREENKNET